MINFLELSEEQIIGFVDTHFELFSSDRDDAFPGNVLSQLKRAISIIRLKEGFAVAYNGRRHIAGSGYFEADLMFLYVSPEFEGTGIGTQLIQLVKGSVTQGVPIILKCEGLKRMTFFKRRGFSIEKHYLDGDHFKMRWIPDETTYGLPTTGT